MKRILTFIAGICLFLMILYILFQLFSCQPQQASSDDPNLTPGAADDVNSLAAKESMYEKKLAVEAEQGRWEMVAKGCLDWLPFLIAGMGGGLAAIFLFPLKIGKQIGGAAIIACGFSVALILAIAYLPLPIAWFGLSCLVLVLLMAVSMMIPELIRRWRALKEIVKGGENFKNWSPTDKMTKEKFRACQKAQQSSETEAIVKKIKEKINGKGK